MVALAKQIRGLQEQMFDMERQRIKQLMDLMRQQEDWIIQQKASWLSITRQVEDMERQAKEMGIAFTSIAKHLDGINGSYATIHRAIAQMARDVQQSADDFSANVTANNNSGSGGSSSGISGSGGTVGDTVSIPNAPKNKPVIVTTKTGEKKDGLDVLKFELVQDGVVIDSFTGGVTGVRSTQATAGTSRTNVGGSMTPLPDGMWNINTAQAKQVKNQNLSNYDPSTIGTGQVGPAWIGLEPQFSTGRSGI
jgi:hypothetical protein